MGALIKTKGTKLLAAHFSDEFSTWIDFYRAKQAAPPPGTYTFFDSAGWPGRNVDLLTITNLTTDAGPRHSRRGDQRTLLPDSDGHPRHANLERRWQWFLTVANAAISPYALSQLNHNAIAAAILAALRDLTYDTISFDVVEDPAAGQTVIPADQLNTVNGAAVKSKLILLKVTGPIPAAASPHLPAVDGPPY